MSKNSSVAQSSVEGGREIAASSELVRWFATYTTPRHEKRIAEHLAVRKIEHFLPLYRTKHRWKDGSKASLELPLFPNYIFARIGRRERVRVLETPGVVSIVGYGRQLCPVPDAFITSLRDGIRLRKIEPHPYLVVGEKVRIKTGAMAGMEGVLVRKKNDFRVVLSLEMIMQSVAVEVDGGDVEPLSA